MAKEKACRVCLVIMPVTELDSTGRCQGCADANNAVEHKMTYGKYIGARYERERPIIEAREIAYQRHKSGCRTRDNCQNCGGIIPKGSKYGNFCCRECREAYEKRDREAKERGAISAKPGPKPRGTNCIQCGKPLVGRQRLYCSERCKYLHHLPEDMTEEDIEALEHKTCQWCGSPILDTKMHKYCTDHCARAAQNARRREKKAAQNG